jgi:hypothetical protein
MAQFLNIPGIGKTSLELLEAAGFHNAEALAKAGVDDLVRELERANSILKIAKRPPTQKVIEKWVASAREVTGYQESEVPEPSLMPVNYEETPQVVSMLAAAPFAIPLPARILMENQLGVAEIPAGILLNRYSGDLDVRIEARIPKGKPTRPSPASGNYVQIADPTAKAEIDSTRFRSTEDLGSSRPRIPSAKTIPTEDRVALLRAPRSTTNAGRDPHSRWYIRGVLHSHPVSIYLGALVTVLLMIVIPIAVSSAVLLLLSSEIPEKFSWVPKWLIVFPVVMPLLGIAYLIWGLGGSCRICGQKLFAHRSHLKNSKAHHVRGLGYVLPLCFQILLFRWFRCTHCGTPVRLKE